MRWFLLPLLVAGCVSTPHTRVEGWPTLQVTEVVVPPGEIWGLCASSMRWYQRVMLAVPVACARIDFASRQCWIIVTETTTEATVRHERMHCEGWDHDGILAAGWARYRDALGQARASGDCVATRGVGAIVCRN